MKKIDLAEAPTRFGTAYPPPHDEPCRERKRWRLGAAAGLTQFGVNLLRLPPGVWSSQRHWHSQEDEFVFVVEGEVVLITDAGEEVLFAGDCAGFKAGEADGHHLQNRTEREAVVLEVGSSRAGDTVEYPDIDLRALPWGYVRKDGQAYGTARRVTALDGVGITALWVAAARAVESERVEGALFQDPFARRLAGDEGFAALRASRAAAGPADAPTLEIRTRFIDDRIARAVGRGVRQIVLLAAGLDARAYRLDWPAGTRLFELDKEAIFAHKEARLAAGRQRCERVVIPVDLRGDWPAALGARGFESVPTLWLVEGLLPYLEEDEVRALFGRLDTLAVGGSVVLFDLIGRALFESPIIQPMLERMAAIGAPWRSSTDRPAELLAPLGWDVEVNDLSHIGASLGRWPFAVYPPEVVGAPRSYLVEAVKR